MPTRLLMYRLHAAVVWLMLKLLGAVEDPESGHENTAVVPEQDS